MRINNALKEAVFLLIVCFLIFFIFSSRTSITYELSEDESYYIVTGNTGSKIKSLTIPAEYEGKPVKEIAQGAFADFDKLKEVNLPDSIEIIGKSAFYGCTALESIAIPEGVKTIDPYAFFGCTALKSAILSEGLEYIDEYAFANCTSLGEISIPASTYNLGFSALGGCTALENIEVAASNPNYKSVDGNLYNKDATVLLQYAAGKDSPSFNLPSSVITVGDFALRGAKNLVSVQLTGNLLEIGECAFIGCTSLSNITLPESLEKIGKSAFHTCKALTTINIPERVYEIGQSAFFRCSTLEEIVVDEDNLTYSSINGSLYDKNAEIMKQYAPGKTDFTFTIPNSVRFIDDFAFAWCTHLVSVVLPEDLVRINTNAFQHCYKLIEVVNKSNLDIVKGGDNHGAVALYADNVISDASKSKLSISNGENFIFYNNGEELYLMGAAADKALVIAPSNYNGQSYVIYDYCFYSQDGAKDVSIPLMSIVEWLVFDSGDGVFFDCSELESIIISDLNLPIPKFLSDIILKIDNRTCYTDEYDVVVAEK